MAPRACFVVVALALCACSRTEPPSERADAPQPDKPETPASVALPAPAASASDDALPAASAPPPRRPSPSATAAAPLPLDPLANLPELAPDTQPEGPVVEVGPVGVRGGLLDGAERVISGMKAGFRACYARRLLDAPDEQGRLVLQLKVATSGSVVAAKVTDASGLDPSLRQCIARRAEVATFHPPAGEVAMIDVPIVLDPGGRPSRRSR